ncbi:hypothetical protein CDAR_50851 [Caerostris darwini]|uniref:Uncharacterized protein n=1 Tax=Caerostris darwini TaxID=1538125 RepID=A0AAV4U5L3_9ARAC|nr:hypothetical protein CDAR_50851 [Caerostris darwini]
MFSNHRISNPTINSTSRLATITLLNSEEALSVLTQSFLAINTKVIAQSFAFNAGFQAEDAGKGSPPPLLGLGRGNKLTALNLGSREFYAPSFPVYRLEAGSVNLQKFYILIALLCL